MVFINQILNNLFGHFYTSLELSDNQIGKKFVNMR
jgi:hypothetical protein